MIAGHIHAGEPLPAPSSAPDADAQFWMSFRRALLAMVDAIEQRQHIPSVIEQYERRQAAKKV